MEKKEKFRGEIGNHTNQYYGRISVYDFFNYGVDTIVKQFEPCEEALRRVKAADGIWEEKEQKLEEKYEEKAAGIQEKLRALEQETARNEKTAALRRRQDDLTAEMHSAESGIERLAGIESLVKSGQLDKKLEENWHQRYQALLKRYKEGDDSVRKQNSFLQPLEPELSKERELVSKQTACERSIAAGKEEIEKNVTRKALEQIRDAFTETEQKNPLEALKTAKIRVANPGDQEQSAAEYAKDNQKWKLGGISLSLLKTIGRGLFCIPMIPVRIFLLNKYAPNALVERKGILKLLSNGSNPDHPKAHKMNMILDGVSILLNIILICILNADPSIVWDAFMALLPTILTIGLVAGAVKGIWRDRKLSSVIIGAIVGAALGTLLLVLSFIYPVLMMLLWTHAGMFFLWLAASIVLYEAEDIYQLLNCQKLEADHVRLMEEGRQRYIIELDHAGKIVSAYEAALPEAIESEKERIIGLKKELEQNKVQLQTVKQGIEEKELELWECFRAQGIEQAELAWQKSRQELAKLQEHKQTMEADIQKINEELEAIERDIVDRRSNLNQELYNLNIEKEREWKASHQVWEDENRQAKERYESLLDSLLKQMRKNGFQDLTHDEEKGVEGFDYRKAWSRMYYLATSVIGMTPYLTWFKREKYAGHEVLQDMISDAAWVPLESANVIPARFITGIERCPMSAEIQEAVKAVMVDWQTDMCGLDDVSVEDRKDYTMRSNLPKDGFYKLCLNQVDTSWEEGNMYPTIFVYDFGNLDENHEKRLALRDFALRTLCAPALQCWQLDCSKFRIDLMLTDHKGDYENSKAWEYYGEAGTIYQGSDIARGLEKIYQAGRRTRDIVGNAGYFAKVQSMAWNGELFEEYVRMMIVTNMDYSTLSGVKDEINNVLDITKPDGGRSRSGICPYFFMDLNRLQEGKQASAQVCLDIVKNFKGNIYKLSEKKNPEDYEEVFYDWKVVEKDKLQEVLSRLAN